MGFELGTRIYDSVFLSPHLIDFIDIVSFTSIKRVKNAQ
jgi:hypothetical protein